MGKIKAYCQDHQQRMEQIGEACKVLSDGLPASAGLEELMEYLNQFEKLKILFFDEFRWHLDRIKKQ